MWSTLLLACSDWVAPFSEPVEPTQILVDPLTADTGPDDPLRAALVRAGFRIGDGELVFSSMEGCCEPGANCLGNNPSTPYGTYALPPAPGEPPLSETFLDEWGPLPAGLSREVLLRPDEAIVWLGVMPPPARYFGFNTYLGLRPSEDHVVIGSLGPAVNHLVIGEVMGVPVWGEPVALVTTADPDVERAVVEALELGGFPADRIVLDRMAPVVNLGLSEAANDTIFTTTRVAIYDDPAAGAAWEADPGPVLRLTPAEPFPGRSHPMPDLPARGSGTNEDAWREALEQLSAAIRLAHEGGNTAESRVIPYWAETIACIDSGRSCTGDSRDRYIGISPTFILPEGAYLVAWGVNHERTGKASYASVSVQTIENQRGIHAVDSLAMVGSARPWLDHPQVDDLYVAIFARDCSVHPGICFEVPWECPGVDATGELKITGRAYLEPSTGAAPVPAELQAEHVLLVFP